jgi:hypothetical protein
VDVIKRKKKGGARRSSRSGDLIESQPATSTEHRSIFQRAVLAALVALAVAGGVMTRRRRSPEP